MRVNHGEDDNFRFEEFASRNEGESRYRSLAAFASASGLSDAGELFRLSRESVDQRVDSIEKPVAQSVRLNVVPFVCIDDIRPRETD